MPLLALKIPKPSELESAQANSRSRKSNALFLGSPDSISEQQAESVAAEGLNGPIQRMAATPLHPANQVSDDLASGIAQQRGGGSPLPGPTRERMEQAFGKSFSSVRVHDNSHADALNQELSSAAFTTGQDIFFRSGQFRPGQAEGQKLLMHELTHAAQADAQPQLIQRQLWTVTQVREKVAIRGRWRSAAYGNIIKAFELWHEGVKSQSLPVQVYFLRSLLSKLEDYLQSKEDKQSSGSTDATKERTDRMDNMKAVRDNVQEELTSVEPTYDQSTDSQQPMLQEMDRGKVDMVPGGRRAGGMQNKLYEVFLDPSEESETGFFKEEMTENPMIPRTKGAAAGIPVVAPNQTGRSVGAHRIDQLLGGGLVPETSKATMPWQSVDEETGKTFSGESSGSVMQIVKNAKPGKEGFGEYARHYTRDTHKQELSKLYLLDLVIGQVDRHEENYMVETGGSHVFGIDNDLSFGKDFKVNPDKGTASVETFGRTGSGLKVDRAYAEKIINLANHPEWVEAALADLDLTDAEIRATVDRLKNLATYLVKRLAKNDNLW